MRMSVIAVLFFSGTLRAEVARSPLLLGECQVSQWSPEPGDVNTSSPLSSDRGLKAFVFDQNMNTTAGDLALGYVGGGWESVTNDGYGVIAAYRPPVIPPPANPARRLNWILICEVLLGVIHLLSRSKRANTRPTDTYRG